MPVIDVNSACTELVVEASCRRDDCPVHNPSPSGGDETLKDLVRKFIDVVRSSLPETKLRSNLTAEELGIVSLVLEEVGFEHRELVPKPLVGHYRDQDGESTGTYPVNAYCVYAVRRLCDDLLDVRPEYYKQDDYRATAWLDDLVHSLLVKDSVLHVHHVVDHIVESRPLPPIVLTPYGDTLVEVTPEGSGRHRRDGNLIHRNATAIHARCRGFVDSVPCSDGFRVLVCRACYFRYYMPATVVTFGDLRSHAARSLP